MVLVPLTMLLLTAVVNEVRFTMLGIAEAIAAALDVMEALVPARLLELVEIA